MKNLPGGARKRIPLNLFGMPFGLLGLADCWLVAAHFGLAPIAVGESLTGFAGLMWVIVVVSYARYALALPGALARDVTDGIAGPFGSLALIVPMLAAADGIFPYAPAFGRTLVDALIAATVLCGALYVGEWISRPPKLEAFHPGYFLPTVAGGFVASASAALIGQLGLAQALFGLGLISWMVIGSLVYGRLLFASPLPAGLTPTLAILVAPAGVATFAYFTIDGDRIDRFAAMIGGYGVLMVLAQLRLLPLYRRLHFASSFWAFTFAWAAVVFGAMFWLEACKPPAWQLSIYLLLAVITVGIGAVAAATVVKFLRGELLPNATAQVPTPNLDLAVSAGGEFSMK